MLSDIHNNTLNPSEYTSSVQWKFVLKSDQICGQINFSQDLWFEIVVDQIDDGELFA